MAEVSEIERPLAEFKPQHEFFVGIDSDGCAFDSMEIKHKECFISELIKYLRPATGLQVRARSERIRESVFQVARD